MALAVAGFQINSIAYPERRNSQRTLRNSTPQKPLHSIRNIDHARREKISAKNCKINLT